MLTLRLSDWLRTWIPQWWGIRGTRLDADVGRLMLNSGNRREFSRLQMMGAARPQRIGIAADHGGFELKQQLLRMLGDGGYLVTDFGNWQAQPADDYPDFVIPLALAVSAGTLERGIAICGSGVGVSVAANKVAGVRGCLIHEAFSAHQGVEDDNLNLICLGGRVLGAAAAWELVRIFLAARFSGEDRHLRRLAKVALLESKPTPARP